MKVTDKDSEPESASDPFVRGTDPRSVPKCHGPATLQEMMRWQAYVRTYLVIINVGTGNQKYCFPRVIFSSFLKLQNTNFPDPDIEEDEDTCIVRIAPKPIKIKIKSLPPPPPPSSSGAGDSAPPTAAAAVPAAAAAVQLAPPAAPAAATPYMHPKKKMAHTMDYLINNDHVVAAAAVAGSIPPAMLSHVQSPQVNAASFPLSVSASGPPLAAGGAANSLLVRAPPPATAETPVRSRRESGQQERRGGRERNGGGGTASSGRKGGGGADVRTKCDVCFGEGTNANLVRYFNVFVVCLFTDFSGHVISIFFLDLTDALCW